MNIYVARHGQTDWNKKGILLGNTDINLNEKGREQALELKKKFENLNFDYIISSDLKRAVETANIISDKEIIKKLKFRERKYGLLEGTTPKKISDYWEVPKNLSDNLVEPIKEFLNRIFEEMDIILEKYSSCENLLIVTHYGVVMAIDAYFHEKYEYCFDNFKLDNCDYRLYSL